MKISNFSQKFDFKVNAIFAVIFFTGICVGTMIANMLPAEVCLKYMQSFSSNGSIELSKNKLEVLNTSFIMSMKPIVFIWIVGFFSFAIYLVIGAVAYRGGILGFTIGVFIKCYGVGRGTALSVAAVLPQNLIYIPTLFVAAIISYKFSMNYKSMPRVQKVLKYFLMLAACLFACLLASLTDAYVTSYFIKLCMNGGK